ncbi:MAG: heparinase II/III-family protein, partial [Acidobacteria bacterium]|nr:heparinase II/III-family protein [Acidobacteriota bacterium]
SANDRAYLLAVGAAVFSEPEFNLMGLAPPPELLWLLGEDGLRNYEGLARSREQGSSQRFADAGTYIMQHGDLFLGLNAAGKQNGRPVSHRHNDALSIEVAACGSSFIVDPGSYVYTADLNERHLFRSTAYHSTVQVDDLEQNTIQVDSPFAFGGEASVHVSLWESAAECDRIVAAHSGYERLAEPVTHQRTVTFNKPDRWWLVEDEFVGRGDHQIAVRFHFAARVDVSRFEKNTVIARDPVSDARLFVRSLDLDQPAELEAQYTSQHYGSREPSFTARWRTVINAPVRLRWAIIPMCAGEDLESRLNVVVGV